MSEKENYINQSIDKQEILDLSFLRLIDAESEKYYSGLSSEDLKHNIKMLFAELRTLRDMQQENREELREILKTNL